jgi:hypothetical protein
MPPYSVLLYEQMRMLEESDPKLAKKVRKLIRKGMYHAAASYLGIDVGILEDIADLFED